MSTHLTILLWLGIIFVVAASIILGLLLKSKKEERGLVKKTIDKILNR